MGVEVVDYRGIMVDYTGVSGVYGAGLWSLYMVVCMCVCVLISVCKPKSVLGCNFDRCVHFICVRLMQYAL